VVAFIRPAQAVNWFKVVPIGAALPGVPRDGDPQFMGVVGRRGGQPRALVRVGDSLYAIGAEGIGVLGVSPGGGTAPTPWAVLPKAPGFRLALARLLEGEDDTLLVIEARDAGLEDLTSAQVREAAHRFLDPKYVAEAEARFAPTFEHLYDEGEVESWRSERALTVPLRTVEDLRQHLPEYYQDRVAFLERSLAVDLETELTLPLSDTEIRVVAPRYRDLDAYRAWLRSLHRPAEVKLQLLVRGASALEVNLPHTALYRTEPAPGIPPAWVAARRAGQQLRLVLPLVREEGESDSLGFYLISAATR